MLLRDKVCLAITTCFGVGYTPLLPGTAACVIALIIVFLIKGQVFLFIVVFISLVLAFSLSTRAEHLLGEKDSKKIVIDDFAGLLISFLFIPHHYKLLIIGFFLFRMFDILKIPPADKIEKCHGAKGIVGDDVVAGIYTNLVLHILKFFV